MKYAITFGAAIVPLVAGHGLLTSPTPRKAGSALESVCGSQIYNNMNSDAYGNIQGETQLIQSDFTADCKLWLCKGFQFSDNSDNVQSYTSGQVVDMTFEIRAPHTGTANVSIVDTATNTVIGDELAAWSVFASNSQASAANETSFSITIPDLSGKCTTAGECVIQHYWNSDSAGQTYESCVDFTVGGSSSGGSSSSAAASSSTAAATSAATSVASSSVAPVTTTKAAVSSAAAATTTSKSVADVTSSSAAPTETADDDDSCDGEGDDEGETTTSTTVTVAPTTSASAPAATETADDSCDSDEDEEATTTTSAFSAEATGESGDVGDEDGCDADDEEPASSSAAAVPTTLVTRTSSRAASATPARTSSKAASASATPTSSSGSVALYGQCGGINYTGATSCSSGTCTFMNDYYSQCV